MHSDIKFLVYFSIVNQHFAATLSEEHFYLSTIVSSWNEMKNICYVGAPSFEFTSGKNVVNDDSLPDVNGKDVWVGYFEKMESFKYVGCLEKEFNRSGFEDFGSPGQCFRQCGYANYFGLMDMKCFCFQVNPWSVSDTSTMNQTCSSECMYQQGVACGGPGFLSVYTHAGHNQAKVHMQSSERSMSCLQFNQDRNQSSWANCKDSNAVACDFSGTYIVTVSPSVKHSWISTSTSCFSSGALMLPFSNNLTSQEKNETVWTNVIRSPVIYHHTLYKEKAEFNSSVIRQGVLTRENDEYILTFTGNSTNRRILCKIETKDLTRIETVVVVIVSTCILVEAIALLRVMLRKRIKERQMTSNDYESFSLSEKAEDVPSQQPHQEKLYVNICD